MTINELLALNNLTANDQIPVWDAEATGSTEPTAKITAQNFANAVKSLASLIGTGDLDATPTQGSTKAVQSGGVYNAIAQSTANLPTIASVTCTIPNTTEKTTFDLPSGFNNAVLLGARCITKYSSLVDSSYSDGDYFGNVTLAGNGKFNYNPKVAGNSTQVLFVFMKTN